MYTQYFFDLLGREMVCRRKKDHGRAESLLLAVWAALYLEEHQGKQLAQSLKFEARAGAVRGAGRAAKKAPKAQHLRLLELQATG